MAASAFLIVYILNIEVVMSQFAQAGDSCQKPIHENFGSKALEPHTDPEDCNKYITCPPKQERRNFYASFLRGRTAAIFLGVMFYEKEVFTTVNTILRPSNRSMKQSTENILCQTEGRSLPFENDCRKYFGGAPKYANCESNGEDSRYRHEDCTKFLTCEKNMEDYLCLGAVWEYKGTDPNIIDRIQIKIDICSSKTKQCLVYLSAQWSLVKSYDYELLPSASTGLYMSDTSRNSPKFNSEMVHVNRTMEYKCLLRPDNFTFNNKIRSANPYRNLHII